MNNAKLKRKNYYKFLKASHCNCMECHINSPRANSGWTYEEVIIGED